MSENALGALGGDRCECGPGGPGVSHVDECGLGEGNPARQGDVKCDQREDPGKTLGRWEN